MAATKLATKNGKLIASGGKLLAVPDAGPCCLCEGCGGSAATHFAMTPPTVTATLAGVTMNPDQDDQFCTNPQLTYRLSPGCEECAEYNDVYELVRGDIEVQPDPHPDPASTCVWSDEFTPLLCTTLNAPGCELVEEQEQMTVRVKVFITLGENATTNDCEVRLYAETMLSAVLGGIQNDGCDYGTQGGFGSADPLILHTFTAGECVWAVTGSHTLYATQTADQKSRCTWFGTTIQVDFG